MEEYTVANHYQNRNEETKEKRRTEYEYTNAYTIQQFAKHLQKVLNWENVELIETTNKVLIGIRSNGNRNPDNWSIVDVHNLIKWIKD